MTVELKRAIAAYIGEADPSGELVATLQPNEDFSGGEIGYNEKSVKLHRSISHLGDEEYVRAYLFVYLVRELAYPATPETIEFEKKYSIGRPTKKGARIDIVVRYPQDWGEEDLRGRAFLFIECKTPDSFDSDLGFVKGQLFDLARQESPLPRYGVYYAARRDGGELLDRALIIDFDAHSTFGDWDEAGQPAKDLLPSEYDQPARITFANVEEATQTKRPLRTDVDRSEFERLRHDLHNIVWGGGGTNNNDVFVMLVRLFLCRIYDELETDPGEAFEFQREVRSDGSLQPPEAVVEQMAKLFVRGQHYSPPGSRVFPTLFRT